MPGQPAARVGDMIACPVPQTTPAALPHAPPPGLPIIPPGCPTVLIGGQPAARIGDSSLCLAPAPTPNAIVKGAMPVPIGGSPAARMTDSGAHPGSMISPPCCPTVLIGLAGTSGNPWAADKACLAAKNGRHPPPGSVDSAGNPLAANTPGQSYNNCGIESSRQIINQANPGANLTQEQALSQAIGIDPTVQVPLGSNINGVAVTPQNQMYFSGGTVPSTQVALLGANGVPATTVAQGSANLATPVAQGNAAIVNLDAAVLWPAEQPGTTAASFGLTPGNGNGHAVLVTGYDYDDAGNITAAHVNDTGLGLCNVTVPIQALENAQTSFQNYSSANGFAPPQNVVTQVPVWR